MKGMGATDGEDCPFEFNFDPASFKVGDTVSYRVSSMEDWPFVGTLLEVHEDHVVISPRPGGARRALSRHPRIATDGGWQRDLAR